MRDHSPPLSDLVGLDLARVLAGPYCTRLLADLGARVIKSERPGLGDEMRCAVFQLEAGWQSSWRARWRQGRGPNAAPAAPAGGGLPSWGRDGLGTGRRGGRARLRRTFMWPTRYWEGRMATRPEATGADIARWFWGETAAGRNLRRVRDRLDAAGAAASKGAVLGSAR